MLQDKTPYRERGADYYMHQDQERKIRQLRKHAKHFGFDLVPQINTEDTSSRRDNCKEQKKIIHDHKDA